MKYYGTRGSGQSSNSTIGVLLVNLGSPTENNTRSVRRYLKEFLSDPRVVEVPRLLWWFILNGVILRFRPARSARNYQKIWMQDGSPLLVFTKAQSEKLQQRMDESAGMGKFKVEFAMRYGKPSIESRAREMQDAGIRKLIIIPLYPQYSCSTTGSVYDEVSRVYQTFRWVPEIRMVTEYYRNPEFISACCEQILSHRKDANKSDKLFLSYHGTPIRYREKGDPYYDQCLETSRLITEQLKSENIDIVTTFQSRFGREPWLQPYTDEFLTQAGQEQISGVQVFCPGFASDCLETLEEIAMENRDIFLDAGGKNFGFIPCLNDSKGHITAFEKIVNQQSTGW